MEKILGRYNTIRALRKEGMKVASLQEIEGQVGVYSSQKWEEKGYKVLDWAGKKNNGSRVWYKGWVAFQE